MNHPSSHDSATNTELILACGSQHFAVCRPDGFILTLTGSQQGRFQYGLAHSCLLRNESLPVSLCVPAAIMFDLTRGKTSWWAQPSFAPFLICEPKGGWWMEMYVKIESLILIFRWRVHVELVFVWLNRNILSECRRSWDWWEWSHTDLIVLPPFA